MTVEQLKSKRKEKIRTRDTYNSRRKDVEKIVSNIDNKLYDDVRAINNKISSCISELEDGLKGAKIAGVYTKLQGIKEASPGNESNIKSCRSNLSKEASRCRDKVDSLNSEIKRLEDQIKEQGGTIYFWE